MLTPREPPPAEYYQANLTTLVRFVCERYADLVPAADDAQLQAYLALDDAAQRLFARILTRKGPILRDDALDYSEVGPTEPALAALAAAGLVVRSGEVPAESLLGVLRKAELAALLEDLGRSVARGARKDEVGQELLHGRSDAQLRVLVGKRTRWLTVAAPDTWALVRFLYFGDTVQDWSAFVMRDLGMVRYEEVPLHVRQFEDAAALDQARTYQRLSALSHRVDEHPRMTSELVAHLAATPSGRYAQRRRDKSLLRIARYCERWQEGEAALRVYAMVERHPARERTVRILAKTDPDAAAVKLREVRADPWDDEEAQFAARFGKRGGGFQPRTKTAYIEQARVDIEAQALELLLQEAEWGAHVENSLFRTLTGLIYWPAIYADVPGAFTNPFQSGPNDLYHDDFYETRAPLIEGLEARLADDDVLRAHLAAMAEDKAGVANSLVSWRLLEAIPLCDIITAIPIDHIRRVCAFLIRNLPTRRRGFPDLLVVYGPGQYELVEVKGPNDQLQPGQRVWFAHFERLRICASVLKLKVAS